MTTAPPYGVPPVASARTVAEPFRGLGDAVVDGAHLLPRAVVAAWRLVRGDGVARYRATYPEAAWVGAARRRPRCSPARLATHAALSLLLGLASVAVVVAVVASLLVSPLLLAPSGGVALIALAGLGRCHHAVTRSLVDRGGSSVSGAVRGVGS